MTVSGPFVGSDSVGEWYDGNDTTTPSPLIDLSRPSGGTFRATYRFSDTGAFSPIGRVGAAFGYGADCGMSIELFDAAGNVLHRGSNASRARAIVYNNLLQGIPNGGSGLVDSATFNSSVGTVSGLVMPDDLYSPAGTRFEASTELIFFGFVSGGTDFITSLTVPTSSSVYEAMPTRSFSFRMDFTDGIVGSDDPYKWVSTTVSYDVTSVSVTPIPTPGTAVITGGLALAALRRRRHR
jgi:hypothetical protein